MLLQRPIAALSEPVQIVLLELDTQMRQPW
jgi:hypothetical protein